MAKESKIEWTEATWNPWHGCHKVSAGCKNCYMFRDKAKYKQDPNVVVRSKTRFYDPLKWEDPRTIFTCSWSDFFIEEADPWRDEAMSIIARTPQHTYQILTKRPERMEDYMAEIYAGRMYEIAEKWSKSGLVAGKMFAEQIMAGFANGLPNVWLGVSVEDQKTADERIPQLVQSPAALRFISAEPLLGPLDLSAYMGVTTNITGEREMRYSMLDWVIVGGESGPDARPMHSEWARSIRDQCREAGVPFFFKQWGEYRPFEETAQQPFFRDCATGKEYDGHGMNFTEDGFEPGRFMGAKWMDMHEALAYNEDEDDCMYLRLGKAKAGRLLDGRTWDEMPENV